MSKFKNALTSGLICLAALLLLSCSSNPFTSYDDINQKVTVDSLILRDGQAWISVNCWLYMSGEEARDTIEYSCGGYIFSDWGQISSPQYNSDRGCWDIINRSLPNTSEESYMVTSWSAWENHFQISFSIVTPMIRMWGYHFDGTYEITDDTLILSEQQREPEIYIARNIRSCTPLTPARLIGSP